MIHPQAVQYHSAAGCVVERPNSCRAGTGQSLGSVWLQRHLQNVAAPAPASCTRCMEYRGWQSESRNDRQGASKHVPNPTLVAMNRLSAHLVRRQLSRQGAMRLHAVLLLQISVHKAARTEDSKKHLHSLKCACTARANAS